MSSMITRTRTFSFRSAIQRSLAAGMVVFAASTAQAFQATGGTGGTPPGGTRNAPEINPAFIVGAVVLVVGGILILTSRRRRAAKA